MLVSSDLRQMRNDICLIHRIFFVISSNRQIIKSFI